MTRPLPTIAESEEIIRRLRAETGRTCGPCQTCCRAIGIAELKKPYRQTCQYQCEKGCGIYEHRPDSCRGYSCVWLSGGGEDGHRPHETGVLVDVDASANGDEYLDVYVENPELGVPELMVIARPQIEYVIRLNAMTEAETGFVPPLKAVRVMPHGTLLFAGWDGTPLERGFEYTGVKVGHLPVYLYTKIINTETGVTTDAYGAPLE